MNIVTALIEHFLNTPFQNFTEKIVCAFMLSEVVNFKDSDMKRMRFIESDTNENIHVSLYQLDRFINPTKGEFNTRIHKKEFSQTLFNKKTNSYSLITIPEDKAQKILCEAMREICQIVSSNIKGYNDEMRMPDIENEDGESFGFSR